MIQNPVVKAEYALVAIATTPKNEISHMLCTDFSWNKAHPSALLYGSKNKPIREKYSLDIVILL